MTRLEACALRLVEFSAPAGIGAEMAGDLFEEAVRMRAERGPLRAHWWLLRQALGASLEALRIRSERGDWLESSAATALLVALPLTVVLAVRRYVLTLIPYRDSADFSAAGLAALALLLAALVSAETILLPARRKSVPVIAAFAVAIVAALADALPARQIAMMAAAAFSGGCLAAWTLRAR